ncbi:MAG: diphosphomevalonate decarboxylase [Xanthomonadales bacterium]|nr:diphosphomevalonate decarboxylase [Xanthomonadales bacterium]
MASVSSTTTSITARAHPNIALIKYWGKRDLDLNLPAAGSLSITLDSFETRTTLSLSEEDSFQLNGQDNPGQAGRVFQWLDRFRAGQRLLIRSTNNFPTAAGLASSASGFAALALAANEILGQQWTDRELSIAARQGSGSAARSVFGGFVRMHSSGNSEEAYAEPLLAADQWPFKVVVAVTDPEAKPCSSTEGMELSRETSPYYRDWVSSTEQDLLAAERALNDRDFEKLADLSEHSCLKMHAVIMASRPGFTYWNGATVDAMRQVSELRRKSGLAVFFTIDAGPQVKAICLPEDAPRVATALESIHGIRQVHTVGLGEGATLVPE